MESEIIFGEMLNYFRKKNNLTMEELGEMMGKTKSAVSRWISGDNYPKVDDIEKLTKIFNTDVQTLVFGGNQSNKTNIQNLYDQLTPPRQRKVYTYAEHQLDEQNNTIHESSSIYLVGATAAGAPLEYSQLNAEQIQTEIPHGADYALTVKGDSMEPLIEDGQIIFYREQSTVENGEIAIVELNRNEVTCKKFYYNGEHVVLKSINDKYEDIVVKDDVRVIGKVII
ncbi:XRE family transcriptional regulator [Atopobacter sp. AH10]|uniref:LexA family transcriptional regulator n=1 Tax=Atopobacter sp. AH10 TaxID=2315861 RepID=UPI001F33823F|nr:XRE family transcriptional regulator [Atopobacter sp. AH10]